MTTIVRTSHKFGDYLTSPALAKLEAPQRMSRPWIVNNAFEQGKMKDIIGAEKAVDSRAVRGQIKETKKRKTVGTNRKYVRNINDIIAQDTNNANIAANNVTKNTRKSVPETCASPRNVVKAASQDDAISKAQVATRLDETKVSQESDALMEDKRRALERDLEFEQQQMMNRMFNNPTAFTSNFPQPTQLVPVMVQNPAGGVYIVHLPLNPPPPPPPSHQPVFFPYSSSVSPASSISPPSSEDGYMEDSNDDLSSLPEAFDESLEMSDVDSEAEECPIELDEELNRLVLSIIDEN